MCLTEALRPSRDEVERWFERRKGPRDSNSAFSFKRSGWLLNWKGGAIAGVECDGSSGTFSRTWVVIVVVSEDIVSDTTLPASPLTVTAFTSSPGTTDNFSVSSKGANFLVSEEDVNFCASPRAEELKAELEFFLSDGRIRERMLRMALRRIEDTPSNVWLEG